MFRVAERARTLKPQAADSSSLSESVWRYSLTQVARALVLLSLAYGTWRNGALQPSVLLHLSLALCIAIVCVGLASFSKQGIFPKEDKTPFPRMLFVLALLWIVYGGVQLMGVPWGGGWFFRGPIATHQQFVVPLEVELSAAIDRIATEDTALVPLRSSSPNATVSREQTRWAIVPFLIALAYIVLAWLLFQTRESRRVLLWALVANCTLLAIWGILQRAGGSVDILPGVRNWVPGIPFSSFGYKNAGATAIMPGAAAALLLWAESRGVVESQYRYKHDEEWLTPYSVTLLICLVLIIIGVAISLSRGAWAAAVLACLIIAILRYKSISRKVAYVAILLPIVFVCIAWMAKDVGESIQERTRAISLDVIASDSRWGHWQDGWATAVAHFPSGSGLGTYGYATLPIQTKTHFTWFREAHNQYLEIATESGLIGIVLLGTFSVWFLKLCFTTIRSDQSNDARAWASFGIGLFCLISVQSLADFVITIPTNLFVYAILMTIVASCLMLSTSPVPMSLEGVREVSLRKSLSLAKRPLWMSIALGSSVWAVFICTDQTVTRDMLAETRMTKIDETARPQTIDETLRRLDDAVALNPSSAALLERRAAWQLQKYRSELMDEIERRGQNTDWPSTDPINLLNFLAAIPQEHQQELLDDFVSTDSLRRPLSGAMTDLYRSLEFNPLRPSAHFRAASIAPIANMDMNLFLDRSIRLSNNDVDKLFRNGLVAMVAKNDEQMIDQWSRSLSINHRYLEPILKFAGQRLEPMQIATELVPPTRPDIFLRLAKTSAATAKANPSAKDRGSQIDPELAYDMIDYLLATVDAHEGPRYSAVAQLFEKLLQHENAATYWEKAVAKQPRSGNHRISYIESLLRLERYTEALNQATVGRTLHPLDTRFQNRIDQARRGVSNAVRSF